MKKVLLAEMTSPELQAALREADTVIIPVGSTEVLGRHGPLGADHLIAAELARRLGEESGCPAAPTVPYGDAQELRGWPGTVSIRFDVLAGGGLVAGGLRRRGGPHRVRPVSEGSRGEVITSVVLAVRPELVDRAAAAGEQPSEALGWHLPHTATSGGPFYTYPDFSDFCTSGGWGDIRTASAEKGRQIIERGVRRMAEFLRDFRARPLPA